MKNFEGCLSYMGMAATDIGIVYVLPFLAHLLLPSSEGNPSPLHSDRINAHHHTSIILTYILNPVNADFPPLFLNPNLATVTPYYPKSLFPCNSGEGCLRWRKARTHLGIPGYACETTASGWRPPNRIHSHGCHLN